MNKNITKFKSSFIIIFIFLSSLCYSQVIDQKKSTLFDIGKMWTFDYPPTKYFSKAYNFNPPKEWFDNARLSTVRLPYCTASFISSDGLLMTNQHCSREYLDAVSQPDENLGEVGFYAEKLDDERRVPGLYVDQLQLIEDVTSEIHTAFEKGKTDNEKIKNKNEKIKEIEKVYTQKTGLICNVVTFYNGGKFSVYGYKRFDDVRLVFSVELVVGHYGGEYDNFTYPRYDMDLSMLRVYDETGKPLKSKNYFKWSKDGVQENDVVFVTGMPGTTNRFLTVSQLEYNRDYSYPYVLSFLNYNINYLNNLIEKHPNRKSQYNTQLLMFSNAYKSYWGSLEGLKDKAIMARKKDFEDKFKEAVMKNPNLKEKYGSIWSDIEKYEKEKAELFDLSTAFNFGNNKGQYFMLASRLVNFALEMKKDEKERSKLYFGENLDSLKRTLLRIKFYSENELPILKFCLNFLKSIENKNEEIKRFINNQPVDTIAMQIIKSSVLNDRDKLKALVDGKPDDLLNSTDPLISFISKVNPKATEVRNKWLDLSAKEESKVEQLGTAIFEIYGTEIPPDATFTLRIADGTVKGYEYNGTVAPALTTFYGTFDRCYSHNKPEWNLPERWRKKPASFDLRTPVNFALTADVVGGNSGSPVINKNQEVVGLIFDGNMESLPGDFIFLEEKNRSVAVHSSGILQALDKIYKADRIVNEIKASAK
jgi:hypothetical protein